jgi:hypothetical protein
MASVAQVTTRLRKEPSPQMALITRPKGSFSDLRTCLFTLNEELLRAYKYRWPPLLIDGLRYEGDCTYNGCRMSSEIRSCLDKLNLVGNTSIIEDEAPY